MKRLREGEEGEVESISMANMLMLLSRNGETASSSSSSSSGHRVFECKTCNRQFPSFQALGGHRASHKKPRLNGDGHNQTAAKPRTHECSICGLEFAIGQALGGHMRRHRVAAGGFLHGQLVSEKKHGEKKVLFLDLNLPPSGVDVESHPIVFGIDLLQKMPMLDCFH